MKKNLFVFCETTGSQLATISYELLTKGRELADEVEATLTAVLIGSGIKEDEAHHVFSYGAQRAYLCDDPLFASYTTLPYTAVLTGLCQKDAPEVLLMGATDLGKDLGARVAARLRTGLTAHCTHLEWQQPEEGEKASDPSPLLLMTRPALGGNLEATIVCPQHRPQMASVMPGVFSARKQQESTGGELIKVAAADYVRPDESCQTVVHTEESAKTSQLHTASVIVCGGFGVGSKKNFALLSTLAQRLGGEVAATRAAIDAGFAERSVQIGQTGLTVRPRLFIACGCSGAIQFTSGMKDSTTIVSINTDAHAPMNALADYVVVGAIEDVLPKMIAAVEP